MSIILATTPEFLVNRFWGVIISTLMFLSAVSGSPGQEIGFTEDAASAIERAKVEKKDIVFLKKQFDKILGDCWKESNLPDYWDGCTASRIVEIFKEQTRYNK